MFKASAGECNQTHSCEQWSSFHKTHLGRQLKKKKNQEKKWEIIHFYSLNWSVCQIKQLVAIILQLDAIGPLQKKKA